MGGGHGLPNANMPFKTEPMAEFDQQSMYKAGSSNSGYNTQITSTTNQPEMDQEIEALLSQKDIATSLAENLLKQFSNDGMDIKEEIMDDPMSGTGNAMSPQNGDADSTTNLQPKAIKCEATSTSVKPIATATTAEVSNEDGKNEPVLKIENLYEPKKNNFTIQMDSKQIIDAVK